MSDYSEMKAAALAVVDDSTLADFHAVAQPEAVLKALSELELEQQVAQSQAGQIVAMLGQHEALRLVLIQAQGFIYRAEHGPNCFLPMWAEGETSGCLCGKDAALLAVEDSIWEREQ